MLVFAQLQTIEHLSESDNWIFHAQLCVHLHWTKTVVFFRRKKSDNSIVNKRVETSVPEFSEISPEFSTNQNFWGCTRPLSSTPLNGQRDINLANSLQKKQNILFFQLSVPAISVASPLHWISYVVNDNLKKSCLLHLREIHNSNPACLGLQRLANLA